MGFYAPAQLVQDARRHGVEVRPVDVTVSDWDCTLETRARANEPARSRAAPRPAHGRRADGSRRAAHRRRAASAPFASVADLAHRAQLDRRDLAALADAGALAALAGHRHGAVWDVAGVEKLPPLLAGATFDGSRSRAAARRPKARTSSPTTARLGLTLRRHPLALLRGQLRRAAARHGRRDRATRRTAASCAPPASSSAGSGPTPRAASIFVTLEDETGATNVIVWRDLGDRQRRELLGARLLAVYGKVEREGKVVHVLAGRLVDLTPLLGALPTQSRDFH